MEYSLSLAIKANSTLKSTVMDQAREIRIQQRKLDAVSPDAENPAWQRGYRHGLAQCNHHPQTPEQWVYTRENHTDLEDVVNDIDEKIHELQGMLTAIEALR